MKWILFLKESGIPIFLELDGEFGRENKYGFGGISKAVVCPSNISIAFFIDGLCDG